MYKHVRPLRLTTTGERIKEALSVIVMKGLSRG